MNMPANGLFALRGPHFVASFVWLFPALDERGGTRDVPLREVWSSGIQVVDGDTGNWSRWSCWDARGRGLISFK
jgi:hypothetical protein